MRTRRPEKGTEFLGVKAPIAGTEVANYWLHDPEFAASEIDSLALAKEVHAVFVLREG